MLNSDSILFIDDFVCFFFESNHWRKIRVYRIRCHYLHVDNSIERKTVSVYDFEHCKTVLAVTNACYILHYSISPKNKALKIDSKT